MSNRPAVLVTGAGGFVGRTLVYRLLERGYSVRALIRPNGSQVALPSDIQLITGNVTDPKAMRDAVTGVDLIFHLAAKLHLNHIAPSLEKEYQRVNVEGSQTLARAARREGVRRFIFFSTINVYGSSQPGSVWTEDSPTRPGSLYGTTKLEAESSILDETVAVVLRLGAVYGPGMKGNYTRLVQALNTRRFILVGDGSNRRTLLHVTDACEAAILAAEHPSAQNRVYNVTDGCLHTLRDIVVAICSALGRKPPRLRLPIWPLRLAAGLAENACKLIGVRCPFNRNLIDKLTEDIAVSGERLQRELGFRPSYDLLRGWTETVRAV